MVGQWGGWVGGWVGRLARMGVGWVGVLGGSVGSDGRGVGWRAGWVGLLGGSRCHFTTDWRLARPWTSTQPFSGLGC